MTEPPQAQPTMYNGVLMRSKLEAGWAATLDELSIDWRYEPQLIRLESGALYLPDFMLPALGTVLEVKGAGIPGIRKSEQLARELSPGEIVIIGFAPVRRNVTSYSWESFLQWRDAAGYDTRLANCQECSAWQWMRPEISRGCRICRTTHRGLLAKPGEMRFQTPGPDRPRWLERA